ncbi:MAG TPA: DUF4158 domain-containing protein, partial [Polyangiales bacterium]|nr:DUF4158 domain-containing protein [Polyangiales bacterium]
MKRFWSMEELHEQWSVSADDVAQMPDKQQSGRLGFVAQLAFYRAHHAFPDHRGALAPMVIEHLAGQVGVFAWTLNDYDWNDRTGRRHRESILDYLGVRAFDDDAENAFRAWLLNDALPKEPNDDTLEEWITAWLRRTKLERPGEYRLDRAMRSTRRTHDDGVLDRVLGHLDVEMR